MSAERSLDPFTLEIIKSGLVAAGDEMFYALQRTSMSPIIYEPIAGIMVAEYYVVRRYRADLERTRAAGSLPVQVEPINPMALVAWAAGAAVGYCVHACRHPSLELFLVRLRGLCCVDEGGPPPRAPSHL